MKRIGYIIGHRHADCPHRLENLLIVLEWLQGIRLSLKEECIDLQVLVVEQDDSRHLSPDDLGCDAQYLFLYNPGYYNRGWAFNAGARALDAEYYFFADNDIVLHEADIRHVFRRCWSYEAVNPYSHIHDSPRDLCKKSHPTITYTAYPERRGTCFAGGIVGISRHAMWALNGLWNEDFRGRGYEDYFVTFIVYLFLYSHHTFDLEALHLWHPWETHTSRCNNWEIHQKCRDWGFKDWVKYVENPCKHWGSATKYATSIKISGNTSANYVLSDCRYKMAKCRYKRWREWCPSGNGACLYERIYGCNDTNSEQESGGELCIVVP